MIEQFKELIRDRDEKVSITWVQWKMKINLEMAKKIYKTVSKEDKTIFLEDKVFEWPSQM